MQSITTIAAIESSPVLTIHQSTASGLIPTLPRVAAPHRREPQPNRGLLTQVGVSSAPPTPVRRGQTRSRRHALIINSTCSCPIHRQQQQPSPISVAPVHGNHQFPIKQSQAASSSSSELHRGAQTQPSSAQTTVPPLVPLTTIVDAKAPPCFHPHRAATPRHRQPTLALSLFKEEMERMMKR